MIRRTLPLLALTAALQAQSTWIVDAAGAGQFADIQAAVGFAQPGDTLVVRAGSYAAFTIARGLRVLGEPGAQVELGFGTGVTVQGLPAGEHVLVRGIAAGARFLGVSVLVSASAGHVHLEDLAVQDVCVMDSANVTCHRLRAALSAEVLRSAVRFAQCELGTGAPGLEPGLECEDSTIVFAEGTCRGANLSPHYGFAQPGIAVRGGHLTLAGGADTLVAAGSNASPQFPTDAIRFDGGTLVVDPHVVLMPMDGGAPIGGSGVVVHRSMPSVRAGVTGTTLTARTRAPGAVLAFVVFGFVPQPVATPFGELWFGAAHVVLGSGALSALGELTVAAGPVPSDLLGVVQSAVVYPDGRLELSVPAVLTLAP